MKNTSQIFKILSLFIAITIAVGCSEDDTVVAKELSAGFTQTINQNTGAVTFLNTSANAVSYLWDFGDGTNSSLLNPIKVYSSGGTYVVVLQVTSSDGVSATFQDTIVINELFNGGLVVNGNFEDGAAPWIQGVDDNNPATVVTEAGNTYFQRNVTNPNPLQPFLVNLSQKLEITQGSTYTITFDAWSDVSRDIIAGIGLSGGTFANAVQTVGITTAPQQYQIVLTASNFGATDARVLFDLNGAAGIVNIDNVSLIEQ
jgi:hypothetical protein